MNLPGNLRIRVGVGIDFHKFSNDPERKLILGGVEFPGEPGLEGHSDADLVSHACADALLGAAGLGDIGTYFPDTSEDFKGANSLELLSEVIQKITDQGWAVANLDCAVVTERPRVNPNRGEMEAKLGAVVGAPVSVKATRAEGMGALGRLEGMGCWATALLYSVETG